MRLQKRYSLIMPTKNELCGLQAILPRIDRSLFHQIIVSDGGSTDGTAAFAEAEGLVVVQQPRAGLHDAEEAAYRVFSGDVYIIFTPDGNSLPERLPALIEKMEEGYDMVIVSRYLDGAVSEDDDVVTGFGNWMFTRLINILFGSRYTDTLVAFRAMTNESIIRMRLMTMSDETAIHRRWVYINSWELGSTLRAARLRLRVAEIPGDEPRRIGGVRKMSIVKNGLGAVAQIIWDFVSFWPARE